MTGKNGPRTLQPSTQNNRVIIAPLQPHSKELQGWIVLQVTKLMRNYPSLQMDEGNFSAYAETLSDTPQARLLRAFQSAPKEFPQFFPTAGQLWELANRKQPEDYQEWQGPTEEERRQREEDEQSGESAKWCAKFKAIAIAKIGIVKRREATQEIQRAPIRELTDLELDARREQLRQQAVIAERLYGKKSESE